MGDRDGVNSPALTCLLRLLNITSCQSVYSSVGFSSDRFAMTLHFSSTSRRPCVMPSTDSPLVPPPTVRAASLTAIDHATVAHSPPRRTRNTPFTPEQLRVCRYHANVVLSPQQEIIQYRSEQGEHIPLIGQRVEGDPSTCLVMDQQGNTHARLKQIQLDNGPMVWMAAELVGLNGGQPTALECAQTLNSLVRQRFYRGSLKSSNKRHLRVHAEIERQRINHSAYEIWRVRQQRQLPWESKGFNCLELVNIGLQYAYNKGWATQGVGTATHVFIAVGPLATSSELPDAFEQWPEQIAICDPWTNISCPAREYPLRFREKMSKWSQAGKQVFIDDSKTWVDPCDTHWIDSVLQQKKNILQ